MKHISCGSDKCSLFGSLFTQMAIQNKPKTFVFKNTQSSVTFAFFWVTCIDVRSSRPVCVPVFELDFVCGTSCETQTACSLSLRHLTKTASSWPIRAFLMIGYQSWECQIDLSFLGQSAPNNPWEREPRTLEKSDNAGQARHWNQIKKQDFLGAKADKFSNTTLSSANQSTPGVKWVGHRLMSSSWEPIEIMYFIHYRDLRIRTGAFWFVSRNFLCKYLSLAEQPDIWSKICSIHCWSFTQNRTKPEVENGTGKAKPEVRNGRAHPAMDGNIMRSALSPVICSSFIGTSDPAYVMGGWPVSNCNPPENTEKHPDVVLC